MATMTSWLNNATPYLQGTRRLFNPTGLVGTNGPVTLRLIRTDEFAGDIVSEGMPVEPSFGRVLPKPSAAKFIELMVQLEQMLPEASIPVRLAIIDLFTNSLA